MRSWSRFRVYFMLGCALASCVAGVYLFWRGDGPAVGVDAAGEWLHSQSSGDSDCLFLGMGLLSFGFTAYAALWALTSLSTRRRLPWLYFGNLAVFLAALWLVLLDSDLVGAASVGDVVPLLSLLPALAPAVMLFLAGAARVLRLLRRPAPAAGEE